MYCLALELSLAIFHIYYIRPLINHHSRAIAAIIKNKMIYCGFEKTGSSLLGNVCVAEEVFCGAGGCNFVGGIGVGATT